MLRDGLLLRSEAPDAVLYIGQGAARALRGIIRGDVAVPDPVAPFFWLSVSQIGRRVKAAALAATLGDGFTGHSGRLGITQTWPRPGWSTPN